MDYLIKTISGVNVRVDSWEVRRLLDEELSRMLGEEFRHVQEGILYQWDEFTGDNIPLREATEEEIQLFDSFCNVMNYFISKEMDGYK